MLASIVAAYWALTRLFGSSVPSDLQVCTLYIYPIKGCAGFKVSRARIDRLGFVGDRRWMVVDAENKFVI